MSPPICCVGIASFRSTKVKWEKVNHWSRQGCFKHLASEHRDSSISPHHRMETGIGCNWELELDHLVGFVYSWELKVLHKYLDFFLFFFSFYNSEKLTEKCFDLHPCLSFYFFFLNLGKRVYKCQPHTSRPTMQSNSQCHPLHSGNSFDWLSDHRIHHRG